MPHKLHFIKISTILYFTPQRKMKDQNQKIEPPGIKIISKYNSLCQNVTGIIQESLNSSEFLIIKSTGVLTESERFLSESANLRQKHTEVTCFWKSGERLRRGGGEIHTFSTQNSNLASRKNLEIHKKKEDPILATEDRFYQLKKIC